MFLGRAGETLLHSAGMPLDTSQALWERSGDEKGQECVVHTLLADSRVNFWMFVPPLSR